ncbi:MAG: hydroxymethylglutaryl-CoA lyase [Ardenticatenales bacterium]|nr:hydroxymethylglutaryl-CoA lyase [Ardenticatenales bacterium]
MPPSSIEPVAQLSPAERAALSAVPAPCDLPTHVEVFEVGPRDGLQNIASVVPAAVKIDLINRLCTLGFRRIEAVSFVHPHAVPQMADAEAVMAGIDKGTAQIVGLVPNVRGVERALACGGIDALNFVLSATESQNQRNLRQSIAESLDALGESAALARSAGLPLRATISTAFGCPFEGYVPPERVLDIAERCAALGAGEICLGDTTGMAVPTQVYRLFRALALRVPALPLAVHLHNTRGSGAANLMAALHAGVAIADASIGGLGGCPFAPGATGNICSEDTVHMLSGVGISTGIDLEGLIVAARAFEPRIGVHLPGQVMRAGSSLGALRR